MSENAIGTIKEGQIPCIAGDGIMTQEHPESAMFSCSNPRCPMQRVPREQVWRVESYRVKAEKAITELQSLVRFLENKK